MWILYSACCAVLVSVVIRLFAGRTSAVQPWRDVTSIVTGVVVGAVVYIAATMAAGADTAIAISSALLWLTATITSVHAFRESRGSHS
ncbi:hypothetical protein [Streptomyces sp. AM6-12]|uniref:hypothetical protein n=1 Tax=Streptomyces sp. AM6-12 TaxID=3345149 RepID=UPI0037BC3439